MVMRSIFGQKGRGDQSQASTSPLTGPSAAHGRQIMYIGGPGRLGPQFCKRQQGLAAANYRLFARSIYT